MRNILGWGLIAWACIGWAKAGIPLTDSLIIRLQADALQEQGLGNEDTVTQWPDLAQTDSIDGTVTSVAGQNPPTYITGILNGKSVVHFSNAQVLASLPFAWLDVNAGVTVIAVCTGDKSGQTAERLYGIGHADGTAGQYLAQDVSISVSGTDAGSGARFNNGKCLVTAANPLDSGFHITVLKIGQSDMYQDVFYSVDDAVAEAYDTQANLTNLLTFPATNNTFVIGSSRLNGAFSGTDYYTGDLAEIIVYNRELSTDEITQMVDYLKAEYGFGGALPVSEGMIIHLDASMLEGFQDGDAVEIWPDLAVNDAVDGTVTQVGSNGLPAYYGDIINGKAVVRFTDAQIMGTAAFAWPDATAGVTILGVFTGDGSGQTGERLCGIGSSTGVSGQILAWDVSTNTTEADGGSGARFNNGKALVKVSNPISPGFHVGAIQINQGGQYQSVRYYVDDMNRQVFDNLANPTNVLALPVTGNVFTVGGSWINGSIGTADFFSGNLAEILIYNRVLAEMEIELMQSYLYNKYLNSPLEVSPLYLELDEGQSGLMNIALKTAPAEDVLVSLIDLSEPNQVTISPEMIHYSVSNWDTPVSVQITAIDDAWLEGSHSTDIRISTQSGDSNYQSLSTKSTVSISDNECSALKYTSEDLNQDCSVTLDDIALLVESWLWCDPMKDTLCNDLR